MMSSGTSPARYGRGDLQRPRAAPRHLDMELTPQEFDGDGQVLGRIVDD
jgi:hypothetical protein